MLEGSAAAFVSCRQRGQERRNGLRCKCRRKHAVSPCAGAFTVVLHSTAVSQHTPQGEKRAQMPSFVRRQWRRLAL